MNKKTLSWLVAIILFCGVIAWLTAGQFFGNSIRKEGDLYISSSYDYQTLIDSMLPRVKYDKAFHFYADHLGLKQAFKPGHYTLKKGMSVIHVVRMLKLGWQTPVNIRINDVKTPQMLAAKLAKQLDADSTEICRALLSPEVAAAVQCDSIPLFSLFLPNTYEVYWTITPKDLVVRMRKEYDRFWTKERDELRWRSGLSRSEVMTLASIVYEETAKTDEMPRIAGVYLNRLRIGMPLQADPTVKYALQDFGLRRLFHKHLTYPSPYNTYINKGLPPSPICMPSIAAIDAVLNFEKTGYLYFCARPALDGYHNFASTLQEHNRNARAYSAELNRRNIK
ncbi:MAG: endolytic transglycosylase MltG [Alistipes sp.]